MNTVTIDAQLRQDLGKSASRALRRQGQVPCVLYGSNGSSCIHFSAPAKAFNPIITSPNFVAAKIVVEGKEHDAFIKDAQYDSLTDDLQHVDFQVLTPGHPILTELPIRLNGLAAGVKAGGRLLQKMRKMRVKAMPEKLVSEVVVDVTNLEVGKSVRVRDVKIEGVEFLLSPATPIASVEITRALRAAAAAAAAAAASAGKKKK